MKLIKQITIMWFLMFVLVETAYILVVYFVPSFKPVNMTVTIVGTFLVAAVTSLISSSSKNKDNM